MILGVPFFIIFLRLNVNKYLIEIALNQAISVARLGAFTRTPGTSNANR